MRYFNGLTFATLLRHPLIPAIVLYVLLLFFDFGHGLRLLMLEPVAWASGEPEKTINAEGEDELEDLKLTQAMSMVAEQARQIAQLRAAHAQLAEFAKKVPGQIEPILAEKTLEGDASNWRHSIYLNRGRKHGVEPGNPVVLGRVLVGVVNVVSERQCQVNLVSDPAFTAPVKILPVSADDLKTPSSSQASRGVVRGSASKNIRLPNLKVDDVAVDADVTSGMLVLTSGRTGAFPEGLLVGRVKEVQNRAAFLDVEIESMMDIALVDTLMILPHRRPALDEVTRMLAAQRSLDVESE